MHPLRVFLQLQVRAWPIEKGVLGHLVGNQRQEVHRVVGVVALQAEVEVQERMVVGERRSPVSKTKFRD
jgi:hypothetical protein